MKHTSLTISERIRSLFDLSSAESTRKLLLCLGYMTVIYMPWFLLLEKHVNNYYLIHSRLDALIPFCEYFVIPYVIWFPFVGFSFLWMIQRESKATFLHFCKMMFGGMTFALLVYTLFPNGLMLRPEVDASRNLCSRLVAFIYSSDTATNVFPSLHVFTSAMIALAYRRTKLAAEHPGVYGLICILSVLIIISTMMIKQHSVMDVTAGFLMAWLIWRAFGEPQHAATTRRSPDPSSARGSAAAAR